MIATPAVPQAIRSRLGWAITDAWVITRRDLAHWARQPGTVIANTLLFPIMIVLMFGYLLGGAMTVPGGGDYRDFLMPGMFAMTMVFGIGATLAAVSADAARGVTDRFRSMPMATSAVIAGRAAADMLNSAAALAVLAGCGLLVGWHPHRGAARALSALGLLLLLRFAFLWIGVYLGLTFYRQPRSSHRGKNRRIPHRIPRKPLRRNLHHARMARSHRTVEPAVLNRLGRPPALRGSRLAPTPPGSPTTRSSWQSHGRCC